jgi:hypothetical protein
MKRLAKRGQFVFLPSAKTPPKKKTKKPTATAQTMAKLCYESGEPFSVSELKQQQRQQNMERSNNADVVPVDGELLSSADGWQTTRPDNPELYVASVRTVRMSDGTNVKMFKVLICPDVLKAKRKAVKKLKQRIAREDREAADVAAKQRVKLVLALMGKRS